MGDALPPRDGVMATESVRPVTGSSLSGRRLSYVELALRVCVAVFSVISLSLIASDKGFDNVTAFKYLLATTILACLYQVVQSVLLTIHLTRSGSSFTGHSFYVYFTIIADLVCCLLLLSGASAALGVTTGYGSTDNFVSQANASASVALIAFLFALALVVIALNRHAGRL